MPSSAARDSRSTARIAALSVVLVWGLLAHTPAAIAYHADAREGSYDCTDCHGDDRAERTGQGPHGYFTATTAKCPLCHMVHEASSGTTALLPSSTVNESCMTCHDSTGASGVFPGTTVYGNSAHASESCSTCHTPHGSGGFSDALHANEEDACFECHDGNTVGVPNILDEITKTLPNPISWQRNDVWPNGTASGMLGSATGDIDGDLDQDYASIWQDRTIRWHENDNGDGSSWSTVLIGTAPVGTAIRSLDVGDLEGDGDEDVVVGYMDTSGSPRNGYVRVYVNTSGDGSTWVERAVRTYNGAFSFYGYVSAAFGDFDNDGDLDVASSWWTTDTRYHENTAGDGTTWGDVQVATTTYESYRVAVGDVTGDNSPDILNGTRNGTVRVYRNNANATSWTYIGNAAVAEDVNDIAIADLDGDTDNDLVVSAWAQSVSVKLNTSGNGTTWSTTALPKYWSLSNLGVEIADVDGDSDMDVLASTGSAIYQYDNVLGNATSWTGAYAFLAGSNDYSAYNDIAAADFDGDGDSDLSFGGSLSGTGRKAFWLENLGVLPPIGGSHPTATFTGRHATTETIDAVDSGNRHAECPDCHEPHATQPGTHALGNSDLAGVLEGVRGVMVNYTTAWTPPSYFDVDEVAEEYELCFRCHSSYTTGYTGGDKALEFNRLNAAMHPIVSRGRNLGVKDSSFTLGTPWNPTAGDDADYSISSPRMTCGDCHASNAAASPRGPHGSTYRHILRAQASTDPMELGGGQNALCVLCHDNFTYNTSDTSMSTPLPIPAGYSSRVYHRHFLAWGAYCLECHDAHGSNDPHMVFVGYTHTATGGTITDFTMCSVACHPGSDSTYAHTY